MHHRERARVRSAAEAGRIEDLGGGLARRAESGTAARTSSGASASSTPTTKTTSSRSRTRSRVAASSRTSATRGGRAFEASVAYRAPRFLTYATYAFVDATFQSTEHHSLGEQPGGRRLRVTARPERRGGRRERSDLRGRAARRPPARHPATPLQGRVRLHASRRSGSSAPI